MYLISYDIVSNSLRKRLSDLLVRKGYHRIQKSVFVGLDNPKKDQEIKTIFSTLDSNNDKYLYLSISKKELIKNHNLGLSKEEIKLMIGELDFFWV